MSQNPPEFLTTLLGSRPILTPDDTTRPYVTLTFAQSLDAKIAGRGGQQLVLSGPESFLMTHWMRTMHDAILIGIGTALNDNPQLNARLLPAPAAGYPPYRLPRPVVLDANLGLHPNCRLLHNWNSSKGIQPWIIASSPAQDAEDATDWTKRRQALESEGATIILLPSQKGMFEISDVLRELRSLGIRSIMVEGGASIITSFLQATAAASRARSTQRPVDTVIVTVAPTLVGSEGVAYSIDDVPGLNHVHTEVFGKDTVIAMKIA